MEFAILTTWDRFGMRPCAAPGKWRGKQWRLWNELGFCHDGTKYIIPEEFITDGASIPRIYRWRFSPFGKWIRAAVIHDWIYRTPEVPISKADADLIFRAAMAQDHVGWWNRNVMYWAVRLFGHSSYRERV